MNFWFDVWFKDKSMCSLVDFVDRRDFGITLSRILDSTGNWNFNVLNTILLHFLCQELHNSQMVISNEPDKIIWSETASGKFTC